MVRRSFKGASTQELAMELARRQQMGVGFQVRKAGRAVRRFPGRVQEVSTRKQIELELAVRDELRRLGMRGKQEVRAGLRKAFLGNPHSPEQVIGFLKAIRKNPRMTGEAKARAARTFLIKERGGQALTRKEIRKRLGPFARRRVR